MRPSTCSASLAASARKNFEPVSARGDVDRRDSCRQRDANSTGTPHRCPHGTAFEGGPSALPSMDQQCAVCLSPPARICSPETTPAGKWKTADRWTPGWVLGAPPTPTAPRAADGARRLGFGGSQSPFLWLPLWLSLWLQRPGGGGCWWDDRRTPPAASVAASAMAPDGSAPAQSGQVQRNRADD